MSSSYLCDACGLPPKPNKKLRNCTRCNSARYHGSTCQKKHYPLHKKICRQIAARREKKEVAAAVTATERPLPLVECVSLTGKGRSLVAVSALSIGCRPLAMANKDGLCAPIVQPTLFESMRTTRCSYCFHLLNNRISSTTNLLHTHCSIECRNRDIFWKNEHMASMKLISSGAISSMPSSTVLTCCRIFIASLTNPAVMEKYNELCYNQGSTEQGDVHLNIITQCHQLLLAMGDTSAAKLAHELLEPNATLAFQFISRLTMNGFTICNAEQEALGLGVYPNASMINHSCRPNAVQSFWLSGSDRRHPPMLQITMCRDAKVGDEVTISYCDVTTPRHTRRKELKENYKFLCDCDLCQDAEMDDALIGLCCTAPGCCKDKVRSVSSDFRIIESVLDRNKQYRCDSCGHSNFDESLKAISQVVTRLEAIEAKLDSTKYSKGVGEEVKRLCDSLTKYCNPQTSWYVAWSCDLFIHWCAKALSNILDEGEQLNLCHQALTVLNKSRNASKFCYDYPGNIKWLTSKGMEAKLRLFVNPMDLEALGILRDVRKGLLQYYPANDEIVSSLDESIRAYSYS